MKALLFFAVFFCLVRGNSGKWFWIALQKAGLPFFRVDSAEVCLSMDSSHRWWAGHSGAQDWTTCVMKRFGGFMFVFVCFENCEVYSTRHRNLFSPMQIERSNHNLRQFVQARSIVLHSHTCVRRIVIHSHTCVRTEES